MNHYKFNRKLKRKLCKLGVLTKLQVNMTREGDMNIDLRDSSYLSVLGLIVFSQTLEGKEFWFNIVRQGA